MANVGFTGVLCTKKDQSFMSWRALVLGAICFGMAVGAGVLGQSLYSMGALFFILVLGAWAYGVYFAYRISVSALPPVTLGRDPWGVQVEIEKWHKILQQKGFKLSRPHLHIVPGTKVLCYAFSSFTRQGHIVLSEHLLNNLLPMDIKALLAYQMCFLTHRASFYGLFIMQAMGAGFFITRKIDAVVRFLLFEQYHPRLPSTHIATHLWACFWRGLMRCFGMHFVRGVYAHNDAYGTGAIELLLTTQAVSLKHATFLLRSSIEKYTSIRVLAEFSGTKRRYHRSTL